MTVCERFILSNVKAFVFEGAWIFDMIIVLFSIYSEIPLLRPPKIKTFCQLKTLFAKFKTFFS